MPQCFVFLRLNAPPGERRAIGRITVGFAPERVIIQYRGAALKTQLESKQPVSHRYAYYHLAICSLSLTKQRVRSSFPPVSFLTAENLNEQSLGLIGGS